MAILVINIPEVATLPMNEFFDYNGQCYALTRSRAETGEICLDPEDFYDSTVQTEKMEGVRVVFVTAKEDRFVVLGWYKRAEVFKKIRRPSFFMEGNVIADAREVFLLPEKASTYAMDCYFQGKLYEVIEHYDARYKGLKAYVEGCKEKNALIRYTDTDIIVDSRAKKDSQVCREKCEALAAQLMNDESRDIYDVKALAVYADLLTRLQGKEADGYYYLAMACYQLGQVKKGMKAIEKALRIEPDAGDLTAMKGNLLVSMGYYEQAARHFHQAWIIDADEDYLILEGRAWLFMGKVDIAYECLKQVENKQALSDVGINLKDMEHKWPFINVRGFNLKNLFGKNRNK